MGNQDNALFTVHTPGVVDDYTGATTETVSATGVPGALVERGRMVQDPVTGTPRTVRDVKIQVPFDTVVAAGDRLEDEDTGLFYPIREVHQYRSGGRTSDKICDVVDLSNTAPVAP